LRRRPTFSIIFFA